MSYWDTWCPFEPPQPLLEKITNFRPTDAAVLIQRMGEALSDREETRPTLVTGFHGVGKLAIVRAVVEQEAFDESLTASTSSRPPRLHIVTPIRISRQITTEALLGRMVRAIYLNLVAVEASGVEELRALVETARLAAYRTAGTVGIENSKQQLSGVTAEIQEKIKPTSLSISGEMTAKEEQTNAEKFIRQFASISAEEMEEQIDILGFEVTKKNHLSGGELNITGAVKGRFRRAGAWLKKFKSKIHDTKEIPIVLTMILHGMGDIKSHLNNDDDKTPNSSIYDFGSCVRQLQTVLGANAARLIVVADHGAAERYQADLFSPDGLLPHIFGHHIYIPLAHNESSDADQIGAHSLLTGGTPWRAPPNPPADLTPFRRRWRNTAENCQGRAENEGPEIEPRIRLDKIWLETYFPRTQTPPPSAADGSGGS